MYVTLIKLSKNLCKITKIFLKSIAFIAIVLYYEDAKTIK